MICWLRKARTRVCHSNKVEPKRRESAGHVETKKEWVACRDNAALHIHLTCAHVQKLGSRRSTGALTILSDGTVGNVHGTGACIRNPAAVSVSYRIKRDGAVGDVDSARAVIINPPTPTAGLQSLVAIDDTIEDVDHAGTRVANATARIRTVRLDIAFDYGDSGSLGVLNPSTQRGHAVTDRQAR